ncbi:MAG: alpha/beta fold hydrolase [Myxococcales bacterium]|nr:alpha/beta fold hydrolase [Myxococcales bacterium]
MNEQSELGDEVSSEPCVVRAEDGFEVEATTFVPSRAIERRGAVLVAGAMGVGQGYYRAFAEWLATQGFIVMTFDYRGTGRSRKGPLSHERADIETWAREDASAVLRALSQRSEGLPITWIGHSLGAQIVGMTPGHERVSRVLSVAAGSGYWRENAEPLRRKVWLFWFGAVPIATPLFGYFPGKRLGMVGDLPKGVIYQWKKWCMNPEYAVGAEGERMRAQFAAVRAPITALSFDDDEMMSEANTRSLHGMYTSAEVRHVRVCSTEKRGARIGHFGFFRREMREALWAPLALEHIAKREQPRAA